MNKYVSSGSVASPKYTILFLNYYDMEDNLTLPYDGVYIGAFKEIMIRILDLSALTKERYFNVLRKTLLLRPLQYVRRRV